jgi:hypothetical protein
MVHNGRAGRPGAKETRKSRAARRRSGFAFVLTGCRTLHSRLRARGRRATPGGIRADASQEGNLKRLLVVVLALPVLALTVWAALVLLFAGPGEAAWVRTTLAAVYALGSLAVLVGLRPLRRAIGVWGIGLLAVLLWWSTLRPSNDGDWQPDVAKLASAEVRGDRLTFHNIRNFDYRSETDFVPRWEDRVYDLSKLRDVDLFMSYWGSPAIAHTIMSWEFEGAPPLAISIETRKRKGQEYSAVQGFFRQYEIIYVAADERDIVRLRTNYRGEDVYLYRLKLPPELARSLLMDYVATMNSLVETPEFYNALVDNCTTSVRRHVVHVLPNPPRFDWRLLVNGYGDQMLYERGTIDARLPFAELRAKSHINARAKALDRDPGFSQGIREGLPDPRVAEQPPGGGG